jgi:hypothetical protein
MVTGLVLLFVAASGSLVWSMLNFRESASGQAEE